MKKKNASERVCKACGKILIKEKLFCQRCFLQGRNMVTMGAVTAVGGVVTVLGGKKFLEETLPSKSEDELEEEDDED